jgi:endonuclease/exonuclease/phosphatase family metal-dependent hydrolase
VRLATWNSHSSLGSKWGAVEALDADVITVQECGPGTKDQVEGRTGWTCEWQVGRYRKGVAVLARYPYEIEIREGAEPCLVSTMISGRNGLRFRFVGFWAMTPTHSEDDGYPQQATRMIEQLPHDGIPTVVAGDFNASSRNVHHLKNVERLAALGMVSAYHSFHDTDHRAPWLHATSYHHWQKSLPFHMDYVFVPDRWLIETVEVGTFENYPGRRLSDHVPIVASLSPGGPPSGLGEIG